MQPHLGGVGGAGRADRLDELHEDVVERRGAGEPVGELVEQLVARPLRAVDDAAGPGDDAPHRGADEEPG